MRIFIEIYPVGKFAPAEMPPKRKNIKKSVFLWQICIIFISTCRAQSVDHSKSTIFQKKEKVPGLEAYKMKKSPTHISIADECPQLHFTCAPVHNPR